MSNLPELAVIAQLRAELAEQCRLADGYFISMAFFEGRTRELEAGMREIVALGDCDNSASKMYFVARRFVPPQSEKDAK